MTTVTAILEYDGKRYTYTQEGWNNVAKDGPDELERRVYYMWTVGNFSCDCNRSMFICEVADDDDYPEFCEEGDDWPPRPCGHSITLIDLQINGESILDDNERGPTQWALAANLWLPCGYQR